MQIDLGEMIRAAQASSSSAEWEEAPSNWSVAVELAAGQCPPRPLPSQASRHPQKAVFASPAEEDLGRQSSEPVSLIKCLL